MRIAVVSDIHGNLTALEAVIADLQTVSPDLVLHGGDLADGGAHPAEVVDTIRYLGCTGVLGNTDEMLFRPESLDSFAARSPAPGSLWDAVREMADWTRERLGRERLDWLAEQPLSRIEPPMALVHARPDDPWRAPAPEADDSELAQVYGGLGQPIAVYGHIHCPFIRRLNGLTVANSGSVGLSYDGDPRAAYFLLEGKEATIRRVSYDIGREVAALKASDLPHAGWTAKMLESARPHLP